MTGWKTKTAGVAGILYGITGLILHFRVVAGSPDVPTAMGFIVGGLAVFGGADKLQKLLDLLKK